MTTKALQTFVVTLFLSYSAFSQNCNVVIKDGSKMNISTYIWAMPNLYDPKFIKQKEAAKDQQILAFNESVSSGKAVPATNSPYTIVVKKETAKEGGDQYTLTVTVAGKDYPSYVFCKNDTLFFYRNLGAVDIPDGNGGSNGFMLTGTQVLPMKLKVGDKIPPYDDMLVLYPQTFDKTVKKNVMDMVTHTAMGDPMASSVKYNLRQVDVKVRETFSFSTHTVHYMNAVVTGEEELTIGGVKYKAYIINSETWSKPKIDVSIETADEEVRKSEKKGNELLQESLLKSPRKQSTNSLGYLVTYLTEWFVPELPGVVRSETYDASGIIAATVAVTGVQ